jgi:phosphoglucomutase/phosphomannomutase
VIGYDSRHHSHEFALEAAASLAAHQITSYLCKEPTPTPFVSFACRLQKSVAAIMITASHNPLDYNGVKVYGKDGAQVVSPDDSKIEEKVASQKFSDLKLASKNDPLIKFLPDHVEDDYLHSLKKLQLHRREDQELGDELYIIYSALHGVGTKMVLRALHEWGFSHVSLVKSQSLPDGNFPTVKKPNPEEKEALALGITQLKSEKADLFIATDPDADRLGVVVMHKERAHILTGNQVACICLYHILSSFKELKILSPKSAVITTIVSTPLFKVIAEHFKVKCFEVLTGFKFIAELIHKWEMGTDTHTFLFGAEESYGYLFGTHARDKDAVISACLIAEIATLYKTRSLTLIDALEGLYEAFGIFREGQISIDFPNGEPDHMKKILNHLRKNPLSDLEKTKVTQIQDYLSSTQRPKNLPESDLLIIDFVDQIRLILRPSGTEPKMKIYGMIEAPYQESLEMALQESDEKLTCRLKAMKSYLEKISV